MRDLIRIDQTESPGVRRDVWVHLPLEAPPVLLVGGPRLAVVIRDPHSGSHAES